MKLKRKQKRALRDILVAAALFLVLLVVHHLTPELWWLHLLHIDDHAYAKEFVARPVM